MSVDLEIKKAKSSAKKGDIGTAIQTLINILETYPSNKRILESFNRLKKVADSLGRVNPSDQEIEGLILAFKAGDFKKLSDKIFYTLKVYPKSTFLWNLLGVTLGRLGDDTGALSSYRQTLKINPDHVEANYNLGTALRRMGDFDGSQDALEKALSLQPNHINAHFNLAHVLLDKGEDYQAIFNLEKILSLNPRHFDAKHLLANTLRFVGRLEDALQTYVELTSMKPDYAPAFNDMGNTLRDQHKLSEALLSYDRAIQIDAAYPDPHFNKSLVYLQSFSFQKGFDLYKWRLELNYGDTPNWTRTLPLWAGEKNAKVVIWAEQGIGDEVMFAGIVPHALERNPNITLQCDRRLINIYANSFPKNLTLISRDDKLDLEKFDMQIAIGGLASIFRSSLESFTKHPQTYLKADQQKTIKIRDSLADGNTERIVGVSWQTSSKTAHKKNIPLEQLAKKIHSKNSKIVSLQYGDVTKQLDQLEKDFGIKIEQLNEIDKFNDLEGLFALICSCDEVITVDNATAQFGGALGVSTSVLLPFSCEWNWGLENQSCVWYDSVRLYRQSRPGDWDSALQALGDDKRKASLNADNLV